MPWVNHRNKSKRLIDFNYENTVHTLHYLSSLQMQQNQTPLKKEWHCKSTVPNMMENDNTWSPVDDRANLKILMMRAIRKTWKRLNKFISSDCLSHRVDAFCWQKLTWMILDISSKFVPSSSRIVIGVVISLSIGCSVTSRGKRLSCRNVQRKNQMEF